VNEVTFADFCFFLPKQGFGASFTTTDEMASAFSSTDIGIPAPRFEVRSDVAVAGT
jgi:hypothetical protein